jgi:hypothetical protein
VKHKDLRPWLSVTAVGARSLCDVGNDAARGGPPSAALDTAELRKACGALFTPEPVARYITDWAVRSITDQILEPSCGDASFLLAAVDRLAELRGSDHLDLQLATLGGVELHEASAGTRPCGTPPGWGGRADRGR